MARKMVERKMYPFVSPKELADNEARFYIVDNPPHRPKKGRFQEQIVFIIALGTEEGERKKLTLTVAEDRLELEKMFQENPTEAIGPCKMTGVEADTPSGYYWVIEPVEESIPQAVTRKSKK